MSRRSFAEAPSCRVRVFATEEKAKVKEREVERKALRWVGEEKCAEVGGVPALRSVCVETILAAD